MTSHVECPYCRVRYPLEKLYADRHDQPAPGKSYTLVCTLCNGQFDVGFQRSWSLRGRVLRALVKATKVGTEWG
jgi:hypothetical protein